MTQADGARWGQSSRSHSLAPPGQSAQQGLQERVLLAGREFALNFHGQGSEQRGR